MNVETQWKAWVCSLYTYICNLFSGGLCDSEREGECLMGEAEVIG